MAASATLHQPLSHSAALVQSAWGSHSATQSLRVAEWLSGCGDIFRQSASNHMNIYRFPKLGVPRKVIIQISVGFSIWITIQRGRGTSMAEATWIWISFSVADMTWYEILTNMNKSNMMFKHNIRTYYCNDSAWNQRLLASNGLDALWVWECPSR